MATPSQTVNCNSKKPHRNQPRSPGYALFRGPVTPWTNDLHPQHLTISLYSIRKLIPGDGRNVVLIRSDITHHPVKEEKAEITICDHALQHVLDHKYAFTQMVHSVKKRGLIGICVYSYENNFLMTHLIEPLKRVLHLLPLKGQRLLAFFPAVLLTTLIRCVWGYPFNRSYHMFSAWRILALASTTRARLASFKPGFEPMRTAWTTSNGCGGPTASSVRVAATKAVGAWAMAASCVRRVRHAVR